MSLGVMAFGDGTDRHGKGFVPKIHLIATRTWKSYIRDCWSSNSNGSLNSKYELQAIMFRKQ